MNRINYTDLYDYVEAEFIRVMGIYESNPEALDTTTRQIRKVDYTEETRKLISALQTVEADLKNKAKVLTNLYIDKSKGIVSDEDYLTISFTLQEERQQLELRKKDIKEKIEEIKRLESEKADVEKVVKDYLKNHKLTHEIVNETIDYIEIGAKEDGQNRVINIYWKL
jgi:site-specific DNA recombinase